LDGGFFTFTATAIDRSDNNRNNSSIRNRQQLRLVGTKERCFIALSEQDKEQGAILEELSVTFCVFLSSRFVIFWQGQLLSFVICGAVAFNYCFGLVKRS